MPENLGDVKKKELTPEEELAKKRERAEIRKNLL